MKLGEMSPDELARAIAIAQASEEQNHNLEDMLDKFVMGTSPQELGRLAAVTHRETDITIDVLMAYRDENRMPVAVHHRYQQAADEIRRALARDQMK